MRDDDNVCVYYDFNLQIVDETATEFVLSNCGETVGEGDATNREFMLMKDVLGFAQTAPGTFVKSISKFDSNLRVAAIKLVFHQDALLRVTAEQDGKHQLVFVGDQLDASTWNSGSGSATQWVRKEETREVEPYISYCAERQSQAASLTTSTA